MRIWLHYFSCSRDGGKLVEIKHKKVNSLADVRAVGVSERRLWLCIRDPSSSRRVLSDSSSRMLKVFLQWTESLSPIRSMWPKSFMSVYAAADACASGNHAQIGGFIKISDSITMCFSESFTPSDFRSKNILMNENAQRDITCYETLAQLLYLAGSICPLAGFRFVLPAYQTTQVQKLAATAFFDQSNRCVSSWKKSVIYRHLQALNL